MKSILILDMSFILKTYKERGLEQVLESWKLGGYFSKVIVVHPIAGLFESGEGKYGKPEINQLDESLVFVEGKIGTSKLWSFIPPLNFLFSQIKLFRLLINMSKEAEVGAVRIGDPYYLGLMGLFLARRLKVPLIIRVCFRYDEIFKVTGKPVMPRLFGFRWIEKAVERFVLRRCDLIAGANEDNMHYALENGGRPDVATIFRYGNLIDSNHWLEPNIRENANTELAEFGLIDENFLATVSRLEPMKCVEEVIRVIAELVRRGHRIKGLIVGDGTLKEELKSLAVKLGVENSIIFAGNRTQEWIATVLPRAVVIASPHMGRALTEAALAGVPIVAYDYDWQREVVVEGKTGYLVPYKNWKALADKIERLLANPALRKVMGANAREEILKMMNPQELEQHERNEYTKLFKRFSKKA